MTRRSPLFLRCHSERSEESRLVFNLATVIVSIAALPSFLECGGGFQGLYVHRFFSERSEENP